MDQLFLCFIKRIGKDVDDNNVFEMLFTADKENFFGEDFEYKPCCLVNEMTPFEDSYSEVRSFKTKLDLDLIQESCCFSFMDCQDGILPLCFQNIDALPEYPEHRLILKYGITFEETVAELAKCNITLDEKSEE